ncbi:hypothetical protein ING2E5A_1440 [Petrimonas mucosa]|uniref:Uncharacterized protein n=1 Tax=Petrimonas mucosa TaxID=1642646 RepID=A0A1G4G6V9_9BACT|nr:hypothetical protein ING2E5A_1440 [Petrimonas mucosa]SFU62979.1 hypothetical protein SAMN05216364_10425 [Porphyromonadaceae bacterium KHP3R9]
MTNNGIQHWVLCKLGRRNNNSTFVLVFGFSSSLTKFYLANE